MFTEADLPHPQKNIQKNVEIREIIHFSTQSKVNTPLQKVFLFGAKSCKARWVILGLRIRTVEADQSNVCIVGFHS